MNSLALLPNKRCCNAVLTHSNSCNFTFFGEGNGICVAEGKLKANLAKIWDIFIGLSLLVLVALSDNGGHKNLLVTLKRRKQQIWSH